MHPFPRCLPDEISVRQSRDLPAPSFRFHLTMDTLGVRLYPSRYRADSGLSPVGNVRSQGAQKKPPPEYTRGGKKRLAARYFPALLNAVSSPQGALTAVFGMGTGVSPPPVPPTKINRQPECEQYSSKAKTPTVSLFPPGRRNFFRRSGGMAARPHGRSEMVS